MIMIEDMVTYVHIANIGSYMVGWDVMGWRAILGPFRISDWGGAGIGLGISLSCSYSRLGDRFWSNVNTLLDFVLLKRLYTTCLIEK